MPTLFIRLQSPVYRDEDGVDVSCDWLILEDDGSVRANGVTDYRGLSELIDPDTDWLRNSQNLVVIVPAEHVLGVSTEVPGRSIGQIRRALPYVVEEYVAADIEKMHLAHGPIKRGMPTRVNLIDRGWLEDWLACLEELDLRAGHLVSDAELLPAEPDCAAVLLEGETALVRTVDQAAGIDLENLPLALESIGVKRVEIINGGLSSQLALEFDPEIEVVQGECQDEPLVYLGRRWRENPDVVNILQGAFTPAKPPTEALVRWRSIAALGAIWLGVGLVGMLAQGFWAGARADSLAEQSEALYRDIFPDEQRINNVRRQMRQKLGQNVAAGGTGFASYLGFLAQGIDRTVTVWSITYTETRDELAADLQLKDYAALDQLKQKMQQLGVNVEITSAEQQDAGVRARVRLQGQGGEA